MNAFGRATLKLFGGIFVMSIAVYFLGWLSRIVGEAFGTGFGIIVPFVPLLGLLWWSLYKHEQINDELKDL